MTFPFVAVIFPHYSRSQFSIGNNVRVAVFLWTAKYVNVDWADAAFVQFISLYETQTATTGLR